MVDDLPAFRIWIGERAKEVPAAADDVVRTAAMGLLRRLVNYTPVDTGRARAGWQVSTTGPPTGAEGVTLPVIGRSGGLVRRPFPVRQPGRRRELGTGYPGRPRGGTRLVREPILKYGDVPDAEFDRRIAAGDVGGGLVRVRFGSVRPPRPLSPRVAGMAFGPVGATSEVEANNIIKMLEKDVSAYRRGSAGIWIFNNVPYIVFLNQGHSRQAQAYFVERAVQEASTTWTGVRILER